LWLAFSCPDAVAKPVGNGRLTVTLTKFTKGTHKVEVRYSGSDTVNPTKTVIIRSR
jgi:hypothetical protein